MGNETVKKSEDFLSQYTQERKQNGGIILSEKSTSNNYFLKEFSFADKQQFQSTMNRYKSTQNAQPNENLLNLVKVCSQQYENFCSSTYKIYVVYEYTSVTLNDQICARKTELKYFDEEELWAIIQSCVNALQCLNPVFALHPRHVYVIPDGVLKVVNNDMVGEEHRWVVDSSVYYAPEKITEFYKADKADLLEKERIFCLGMTALHAANLDTLYGCYNYEKQEFKVEELEQYLAQIVGKYSEDFVSLVGLMLDTDPKTRITLDDVKKKLDEVLEAETNYEVKHNSSMKKLLESAFEKQTISQSIPKQYSEKTFEPLLDQKESERQSSLEKDKLFTDPKILQMIRKDMESFSSKNTSFRSSIPPNPIHVIQEYDNGQKYEGFIVDGMKEGQGKLTYEDGAYYEGQFKGGRMEGTGTLYYGENRPAYSGHWVDDQFHGEGVLYNECPMEFEGLFDYEDFNGIDNYWIRYEGQFLRDNKSGLGKLILSNGDYFEGYFCDDQIHGEGTYCTSEGKKIRGAWRSNRLTSFL